MHDELRRTIQAIPPHDEREAADIATALAWLDSGAEFSRDASGLPLTHLVAYFVPIDFRRRHLLLGDHRRSGLWLPPGGHVERGETPAQSVAREAREELGLEAIFAGDGLPSFLTITGTVAQTPVHTDVSLWYVLDTDTGTPIVPEEREYHGVARFHFEDVPRERVEPNLARFVSKLRAFR